MKNNICALIVFLHFLTASTASARTFFGSANKSQGQNVRWTLADWLTQKKEFKIMDQWLAMNKTKDLFEIHISGGQSNYDYEVGGNVETQTIDYWSVAFQWSIFGLRYTNEDSDEDWTRTSTQLSLRLLGTTSAGTYLDLMGGQRNWKYEDPANKITQNYGGAKINLYIFSFFGLDGEYKKYFRASDSNSVDYESERVDYGAFFDLYFIRLYGGVYKETDTRTDGANPSEEDTREGSQVGAQFYF